MNSATFPCPCCGADEKFINADYAICRICGWENDPVQLSDPNYAGGANELSLNQARLKFKSDSKKTLPVQKFIINGNHFSNLEGFFVEAERVLAKDFKSGRNMNAFIDLLRGGLGKFGYEEPIELTWKNSEKSKREFGDKLFNDIVSYIQEQPHVNLRLD